MQPSYLLDGVCLLQEIAESLKQAVGALLEVAVSCSVETGSSFKHDNSNSFCSIVLSYNQTQDG